MTSLNHVRMGDFSWWVANFQQNALYAEVHGVNDQIIPQPFGLRGTRVVDQASSISLFTFSACISIPTGWIFINKFDPYQPRFSKILL